MQNKQCVCLKNSDPRVCAESRGSRWLPTEQTSGPQAANFLILCGLQVELIMKSSGTKSTWEAENCRTNPIAKHSDKWLGPARTMEKKGCCLASRGLSLPRQKPSRVRGKSGLPQPAGPMSAARRELAWPKRVPTRSGGTHVRSPPAQQRSTIGKRGPRASAPRSPVWRAPGPAHTEGDVKTLRREEGRKRRTLQGPGLGEQSFATSPRRGQQEVVPSIPYCRGVEPGPARPGRKTGARRRGGGLVTGRGLAKGGAWAGLAAAGLRW